MSRLIINNIQIELEPSKPIARTLQVNDIASLNNRQANFTPTFSIPRTAKNIRAFAMLGIVGNTSNIPYQRNEAYYYAENGECLIYKGWAVITATDKEFKCNLYDGAIDFYKAIENDTLASLPLDEINHVKTLDNVIDSINGLTTYKYILADYNGKALYDGSKINIDYLVPSVPISYLWDKIFEYYGFTYSGEVFNTFDFQNLFLTFPKGVGSTIPDVDVYESDDVQFPNNDSIFISLNPVLSSKKSTYLKQLSNDLNNLDSVFNDIHFKPTTDGLYRIQMTGEIRSFMYVSNPNSTSPFWARRVGKVDLYLAKNSESFSNSDDAVLVELLQSNLGSDTNNTITGVLNVNKVVQLNPNDSFCLVLKVSNNSSRLSEIIEYVPIELTISKVENENIDFEGAFIDLKTKDFLNEVLTRFSLTPFKDKYSNNITFKTLYEILQDSDVIDWSDKFDSVNSESYVYGSYAQQNNFVYKYNEAESDYYNGSINVENENIADSKDVIKSVIYAPEKLKSNVLPRQTNVYKLWNKEVKDDGSVNYKSLDKHFYLMRSENYIFDSTVIIGSETLTTETTIAQAPFESFFKLPFNDVVQDYYLPIYQILNNAKIINANIYLKEQDIINIDFSKLYWIEQLGNYFLLNKILNFSGNGITKVELIKVDYTTPVNNLILPIANEDNFEVNNFDIINLDVLSNDILGIEPTNIISIDSSSLTSGSITNNLTNITYIPNGISGISESFTYTIKDSLSNESSTIVTLNVVNAIIEDGFRTIGSPINSSICEITDFISCKFKLSISGLIQNGDICLNNDLSRFNGFNNYFRVYLSDVPTDSYNVKIDENGIITINNLC